MSKELIYPYRPSLRTLTFGLIFFGAIAFLFVHMALNNDRGLLIDRVIALRPDEATMVYWILAALSAGFVAVALFSLWVALTRETVLVLGAAAIRLPVGLAKREVTIRYADIRSIQLQKVKRHEFLTVMPKNGKPAHISATLLPSKEIFMSVRAELSIRARSARQS